MQKSVNFSRNPATALPRRMQHGAPAAAPVETVVLCPVCRHKMRRTEEVCPGCGAERLFGPTRGETLISTVIGLIAAPALSLLLIAPSFWTGSFAVVGALLGFFVAHSRHTGDRWLKNRK